MQQAFEANGREVGLFRPNQPVLLAVSGGVDSMVMLHLFLQAGIPVGVAHAHLGLRGKEADADEQFLENYCQKRKVPFFSKRFDTKKYAKKKGVSIQMAARVLRYEWLEIVRSRKGFACIATAHHINDSIETLIWNLAKGTGIKGLVGIKAKWGKVIRPMLFAEKKAITAYAQAQQIPFRADSSNTDEKYDRNFIRRQIMPKLRTLNPNVEGTFQQTIRNLQFTALLYGQRVQKLRSKLLHNGKTGYEIRVKQLLSEPFAKNVLYELLHPYGFNNKQVSDIFDAVAVQSGRQFLSATHRVVKDRERLIITAREQISVDYVMIKKEDKHIKTAHFSLSRTLLTRQDDYNYSPQRHTADFDLDRLEFPLVLRQWQPGDYFYPLGMEKKKKIARFLIDEKVPLSEKEQTYVLSSGKTISWVVGRRMDSRFRITPQTRRVYRLAISYSKGVKG